MTLALSWKADLDSPSGYSRAARAHMRALIEMGAVIHAEHIKFDKSDAPLDAFWREHIPRVIQKPPQLPKIKVWQMTPDNWGPLNPHQYNIGYCVWETDRLPDQVLKNDKRTDWVRQMNLMNEVWTSSQWCRNIFIKSGVTRPVYVFPHPIDLATFSPGKSVTWRDARSADLKRSRFWLLSFFQWNKRKNPDDMISFYTAKFATSEDVGLIVKTYGLDFQNNNHILEYMRTVRHRMRMPEMVPNVFPITELMADDVLPDLYRSVSVLYNLSHGEGFGMPFQEAMACGTPCIYPRGTAMDEYIDEECGYPVETVPGPVTGMEHVPWYQGTQRWRIPLFESACEQFDKAYDDWKSGRVEEKGRIARERIEKLHSFEKVGRDMYERLMDIVRGTNVPEPPPIC